MTSSAGHAILKSTKKRQGNSQSRQRFLTEMKSSRVSGPGLPAIGFVWSQTVFERSEGCAIW